MNTTRGRSIIVTGGASGIGKAAVQLLVRDGCSVTIADLDEAGGKELVGQLESSNGGGVQFIKTDVSRADSVRAMVDRAVAAYGGVDGAVNSAGVPGQGKPVHELGPEEWDFCNNINLRGMFLCLKFEIAAMLKGRGGAIVAISSAAAVKGLVNSSEYCASKAGITGLVRAAAIDYAQSGIRVNALLPGGTSTPLAQRSSAANPKLAGTIIIPVGRMAEPDEIAAGAVWLISDQASYVTGTCLAIDGGMTIA